MRASPVKTQPIGLVRGVCGEGKQAKACLKTFRHFARKVATQILCRAHFNPRYVWKNGVIGSVRLYVGLEDEHEENWTALFVDLIYVAMCSKLAHTFLTCEMNVNLFLWTATLMQIFFFSRFFLDEYNIRFETDDLFHRMLTFLYIFGICIILVNINFSADDGSGGAHRRLDVFSPMLDYSSASSDSYGYQDTVHRMLAVSGGAAKPVCSLSGVSFHAMSMGFYMTRVALLLLYVGIMLIDQSHRVFYMFSIRVLAYIASIIMVIITDYAVHDPHMKVYPLLGAVAFEFFGYVSGGMIVTLKKAGRWDSLMGTMYFPINYLVAQQRVSIYILVVLGESMLMLLLPNWSLPAGSSGYLAILFSLLMVFMFAMQYFDQVVKGKSEVHAARRDIVAGYMFNMLHGLLGYALLVVSSSVYTVATTWEDHSPIPKYERYNLCVSCYCAGLLMQVMRMQHKGVAFHFENWRRTAHAVYRFFVIMLHLVMIWAELTPLQSVIVHSLLVSVPVVSDLFFHYWRGDEEINVHRQRRNTMIKLKGKMCDSKLNASDANLALAIASGAPMERKRASLIALQQYNPNDTAISTKSTKDDDDDELGDGREDAGLINRKKNTTGGTAPPSAASVGSQGPKSDVPNKTFEPIVEKKEVEMSVTAIEGDATASANAETENKEGEFGGDGEDSGDDVMDEAKHLQRKANARKLQGGRVSQQKTQSGQTSSNGATWSAASIGGESEEEALENLALNLADGNVDNEFVERFTRASETVRRLSMQNLDIDTLLVKADKHEQEAARSRAASSQAQSTPARGGGTTLSSQGDIDDQSNQV